MRQRLQLIVIIQTYLVFFSRAFDSTNTGPESYDRLRERTNRFRSLLWYEKVPERLRVSGPERLLSLRSVSLSYIFLDNELPANIQLGNVDLDSFHFS